MGRARDTVRIHDPFSRARFHPRTFSSSRVLVCRGDFEPVYTNFTPLWRCTLDFIFLLPPLEESAHPSIRFTSLLKMHDEGTMGAGLPRKGIEPSDHVAVATEVELSRIQTK